MESWVDTIPPMQQPMRYGNKAYRTWHARLAAEAPAICRSLLLGEGAAAAADPPEHLRGAEVELIPYLCDAFGNATRIDYGTGHETSFVVFLCKSSPKRVTLSCRTQIASGRLLSHFCISDSCVCSLAAGDGHTSTRGTWTAVLQTAYANLAC